MSFSKKLIQVYSSAEQKDKYKKFLSRNFEANQVKVKSLSQVTWQMIEILMALEDEMDFTSIHDHTSFKREFVNALEKSKDKESIINYF